MTLGIITSVMVKDSIDHLVALLTAWYESKLLPVCHSWVWLAFRASGRGCKIDILTSRRVSGEYVIHLTRRLLARSSIS